MSKEILLNVALTPASDALISKMESLERIDAIMNYKAVGDIAKMEMADRLAKVGIQVGVEFIAKNSAESLVSREPIHIPVIFDSNPAEAAREMDRIRASFQESFKDINNLTPDRVARESQVF